jgi:hypothetical protein
MTKRKIKAHLIVGADYDTAIVGSQFVSELQENCDEHNSEFCGENWRNERRDRVVVTVEFEIDDDLFEPKPIPVVAATEAQEGEGS